MDTDPDAAVVVLAAGAGTRLRPLTLLRPKPLCPVGDRALLDHALDRVAPVAAGRDVAVNVHHGAAAVVEHLGRRMDGLIGPDGSVTGAMAPRRGRRRVAGRGGDGSGDDLVRVTVSWEQPEALGTAGALSRLRPWLDGRGALVVNGDAWTDVDLAPLLAAWSGSTPRLLTVGSTDFGPTSPVAGSLIPWSVIEQLPEGPSGLWETCWRDALADGSLEVVGGEGSLIDCGTPGDYLRANLGARRAVAGEGSLLGPGSVIAGSARASVVGAGALIEGTVDRCVVWPGAHVEEGEHLVRAIRAVPSNEQGRQVTVAVR